MNNRICDNGIFKWINIVKEFWTLIVSFLILAMAWGYTKNQIDTQQKAIVDNIIAHKEYEQRFLHDELEQAKEAERIALMESLLADMRADLKLLVKRSK